MRPIVFNPPSPGVSIGSPLSGGTPNSILFLNSSGNLAQNSSKLIWNNDVQFKVKTENEHPSNGAFVFEFKGWVDSAYTRGVIIRSTDISAYTPPHLTIENSAYDKNGYISATNQHGLILGSHNNTVRFVFQELSNQIAAFSSLSDEPTLQILTISASRVGQLIKLAAGQTGNAFEVQPYSSTHPIMKISANGTITALRLHVNSNTTEDIILGSESSIGEVDDSLFFTTYDAFTFTSRGIDICSINFNYEEDYMSLMLYDVYDGSLKKVYRGPANSGGPGYRILRVEN